MNNPEQKLLRRLIGTGHVRPTSVLVGCALWLALLGWIDRATGYELDLFAFYTAPVGVVAWIAGQGMGILVAFAASIVWYMADRFSGWRYSSPFYVYWNIGMHFSSFIINAVTVAKVKSNVDKRVAAERALKKALAQLAQATAGDTPSPKSLPNDKLTEIGSDREALPAVDLATSPGGSAEDPAIVTS